MAAERERTEKAQEEKRKTPERNLEAKYQVEELSKAANALFGVQPECVKAAFFVADRTEATEEEARKIVGEFMGKEVH